MNKSNKKSKPTYLPFIAAFIAVAAWMLISHLRSDLEYELAGPPDGVMKLYTVGDNLVAISKANEFYLWDWNNLEAKPQKGSVRARKLLCLDDKRILHMLSNNSDMAVVSNFTAEKIYKRLSLGYNKQCTHLEISGNGRFVVFAMADKTDISNGHPKRIQLKILDVNSYQLSFAANIDLADGNILIRNIVVSNDGKLIGLVGKKNDAGWIALTDANQKKLLWEKTFQQVLLFFTAAFSPGGDLIYTRDAYSSIHRFESKTAKELPVFLEGDNKKTLGTPSQSAQKIVIDSTGRFAAAVVGEHIEVWDVEKEKTILSHGTSQKIISGITISHDSNFIATSDMRQSGKIQVWKLSKP